MTIQITNINKIPVRYGSTKDWLPNDVEMNKSLLATYEKNGNVCISKKRYGQLKKNFGKHSIRELPPIEAGDQYCYIVEKKDGK